MSKVGDFWSTSGMPHYSLLVSSITAVSSGDWYDFMSQPVTVHKTVCDRVSVTVFDTLTVEKSNVIV